LSRILWDLSGIPWDPTSRGIYTASCMDICVGSQLGPKGSHKIPLPMLLYGSYKSSSVGIGLTIYCMSGILWDLGGIPWDPTHRGIYAASCMDICVGSQLDPKGSHMIPLKVATIEPSRLDADR
jgi:hypothetical protein